MDRVSIPLLILLSVLFGISVLTLVLSSPTTRFLESSGDSTRTNILDTLPERNQSEESENGAQVEEPKVASERAGSKDPLGDKAFDRLRDKIENLDEGP